jgi:hypothetical protein
VYKIKRGLLAVLLALVGTLIVPPSVAHATGGSLSTAGTDFWVAFENNYTSALKLFITGSTATTGTVYWPDTTTTPFTVTPGQVTSVPAAQALLVTGTDGLENKGIHIAAGQPVTVYGVNQAGGSSDAYVALPTPALGTRYRAVGNQATTSNMATRIMVVGTEAGTTLTVTPKSTLGARTAGTPYTVSLTAGQVYTLADATAGTDVTGTLVTSDKPVAMYAGVDCGQIGTGACDQQVEQMTPTNEWGTDFLAVRFKKATGGDPIRVQADTNNTVVQVNGNTVATLNAGDFYAGTVMAAGGNLGAAITTSQPALVVQYMTNNTYTQGANSATGDPSSMLVPPYQQYLTSYTLATPGAGFLFNAINIAIPTSAIGSLQLDGNPVSASEFNPIGASGFSEAQLLVSQGTHNLHANAPFGAFAYGANNYNSYAYPGGAGLSPVASIAHVALTPSSQAVPVAHQGCVTATVTDTNSSPVAGVRVDLAAGGTNSDTANGTTDNNGQAQLCYTGSSAGVDTVTATAGTQSHTAQITWTSAPVAANPPSSVTQPTAAAGDQAIKATWTAPTANGSPITGYTATATPGGATCEAGPTATDCVIGNLTNGTTYTVKVVAHSAAGDSSASPASATVTPSGVVGGSSNLHASDSSPTPGGAITLTATGFQPGSSVDFYLHSAPVYLGSAVANGSGVATLHTTLSSGIVAGSHTLTAQGLSTGGVPVSRAFGLTIAAASGHLPVTGFDLVRYMLMGLVLIAMGVGLLVAAKRDAIRFG